MTAYADFLERKEPTVQAVGIEPGPAHPSLFGFQTAIVQWAIRLGRAAIFADTGLGKSRMQIEWLTQMADDRGLIVAPLAVAEQTIAEAQVLGVTIRYAATQDDVDMPDLYITNYERLHRFAPEAFGAVVLDESSILKSISGKTRERLVQDWTVVPYRLACTATPAPNDLEELANHAEFLGVCTRREMLATYFVHDDEGWRIKGHARDAFYRWLATWAVYLRKPSDLGYPDDGFDLPPLNIHEHRTSVEWTPDRELFPALRGGVQGRATARRQSIVGRVAQVADLILAEPDEQWVVWCGLNSEQDSIAAALGGECVSVQGSTPSDEKVALLHRWLAGDVRVLVSKASIFGFGLNLQRCARVAFLGLGDSFETYYQATRRCWRFGQTRPVDVHIVLSEAESKVAENVRAKEQEHDRTAAEVVTAVARYETVAMDGPKVGGAAYLTDEVSGDGWRLMLGDSVERLHEIESASVGLSVFSPPFSALYTYSDSPRDLGNCKDYDEFFGHLDHLIPGLLRATMPGRRACVHVQQVTMTKNTHGVIGWFDFRADVVRHMVAAGWIYDGEIVIDKDPQAQAIRTKSKALMFVQKNKDSSWSRPAMADYILLFRAPGENPIPVRTDVTNEEWIRWARPIWYGIRESATLQASAAREEQDEKHIAPLQLETVERCLRLWSNAGETVLDPFAGIGTTGYVALKHDRRFVGVELKRAYFEQACRNLRSANAQPSLFAEIDA